MHLETIQIFLFLSTTAAIIFPLSLHSTCHSAAYYQEDEKLLKSGGPKTETGWCHVFLQIGTSKPNSNSMHLKICSLLTLIYCRGVYISGETCYNFRNRGMEEGWDQWRRDGTTGGGMGPLEEAA